MTIVVISALHYAAPTHAYGLHDIYRRLYYIPIILAAFDGGLSGGFIAAAVVCAAYAPHAFGPMSQDPASDTQKILEMVLYLAIGGLTGWLVSRLKDTRHQLLNSVGQLRSTEEQLVRAAKLAAVGRLSAGLAHEIRNPLASIKGSAEILGDDFPPEHPKHRLLQVLIAESTRLNSVLSRFLAFARPQSLEQQDLEVTEEIEAVVSLLRGQRDGRSIRFDKGDSGRTPIRLQADRGQLHQVLLNVLLNACQAAGEAGVVSIRHEVNDDRCHILVHDSGGGFTPEAIENAFTPFFTTKPHGTGLGLAVSHRIIESHGGRIRVENHKNGGALVDVEIPLRR